MADMIIQNFEGQDGSEFFIDTTGSDVFPASPGTEIFPQLLPAELISMAVKSAGNAGNSGNVGASESVVSTGPVPENGQSPLSEDELSKLSVKLGKSHLSGKDLRTVEELLGGKVLFSAVPEDEQKKKEFSVERLLKDLDALLVFTGVETCKEFLNKYSKGRYGMRLNIAGVPFEAVRQLAVQRGEQVYIDPDPSGQRQFAGIDGKTDTLKAVRL
ncbi:MAG: hypothetical protein IIY55_02350 [Blautia sp.]|nr:hypothetical protein [Blautia sp.]